MRGKLLILFWILFLVLLSDRKIMANAAQENEPESEMADLLELYDFDEINQTIKNEGIDFETVVNLLIKGDFSDAFGSIRDMAVETFFGEFASQRVAVVKIILLAILSAMFSNLSVVLNQSQISETGFFITYLAVITVLLASFQTCSQILEQVTELILEFMKVLIPSLVLSAGLCCGKLTAVGFGEIALFVIYVGEALIQNILIPVIRIYVILMVINHMLSEDYLSGFGNMVKQGILIFLKAFMAVVMGMNIIKGMILPTIDLTEKYAAAKLVNLVPGAEVLTSAGGLLFNSAMIIKNAVGGAGILVLLLLTAVPVCKLVIFIVVYQVTAALIQPVCDKRITKSVEVVADGVALLNRVLMTQVVLFAISIALLCFMTSHVS